MSGAARLRASPVRPDGVAAVSGAARSRASPLVPAGRMSGAALARKPHLRRSGDDHEPLSPGGYFVSHADPLPRRLCGRARARTLLPCHPRVLAAAVRRRGVLRGDRGTPGAQGLDPGAGLRRRVPVHPAVVDARRRHGAVAGALGDPGRVVRRAGRGRGAVAAAPGGSRLAGGRLGGHGEHPHRLAGRRHALGAARVRRRRLTRRQRAALPGVDGSEPPAGVARVVPRGGVRRARAGPPPSAPGAGRGRGRDRRTAARALRRDGDLPRDRRCGAGQRAR